MKERREGKITVGQNESASLLPQRIRRGGFLWESAGAQLGR